MRSVANLMRGAVAPVLRVVCLMDGMGDAHVGAGVLGGFVFGEDGVGVCVGLLH